MQCMYLDVTDNDYDFADENRVTPGSGRRSSPFELLKSMTTSVPFQIMPM